VAGLLVFNLGVIAMIALVPGFGLRFIGSSDRPGPDDTDPSNPVRRVRPALIVSVCLAVTLAVTNAAFARYDAISSGLADARLGTFDVRNLKLAGWDSRFIAAFPQARQYFDGTAPGAPRHT